MHACRHYCHVYAGLVFASAFASPFLCLFVVEQHDVYGPYAVLECSRFLPLLYSGKGALLCTHSVDGKLLYVCQPFDAQNIHGVREVCCNGDAVELLAFSDKYIRHLELRYDSDGAGVVTVQIVNRFKLFDDFIWDCALVNDKRQLLVGFAHNRVQVYTIRDAGADGDGHLELVGDVRCTPQCVLYCMNLCTANSTAESNADDRMLVASGTCFHDVTLWYMSDSTADAEVKCTLKGHTGVVFRMKFCEATMTLLTVSDDRCVRFLGMKRTQDRFHADVGFDWICQNCETLERGGRTRADGVLGPYRPRLGCNLLR